MEKKSRILNMKYTNAQADTGKPVPKPFSGHQVCSLSVTFKIRKKNLNKVPQTSIIRRFLRKLYFSHQKKFLYLVDLIRNFQGQETVEEKEDESSNLEGI